MKDWFRLPVRLAALALIVSACTLAATEQAPTTATSALSTNTTVAGTTTTVEEDPCPDEFCVIYHIHPDAIWSDGTPVTAHDFIFTYEVYTDAPGEAPTVGYELISGHEAIDEKTVLFAFSEVYGPWRTLFEVVLPQHALADQPAALERALMTTAGPFILHESIEGESITLRRNQRFWSGDDPLSGSALGDVQVIHFVFIDAVRDRLQALEKGEVDVIELRPLAWMVEEVAEMETVEYQLAPGPFWEHIDFNHDDPLLSQRWVREVISLAIDRESILDETVRTIDPEAIPLGSTVWPAGSVNYEDHFQEHDAYDPEAAERLMIERFCEKRGDGIYSCQGRRMSFIWATTVGDEFRERQFELVEADLEKIGIELIADFRNPSELFSSEVLFGGPDVWQLINFSWKTGADPHLGNSTYHCRGTAPSGFGALNVNRYCDDDVETLIRATAVTADALDRAGLYNEADSGYLSDLALIPLYQKPALLAWSGDLTGPQLNLSRSTYLWNVAAWSGKETVVIALDSEPGGLNPLLPRDDNTSLILAAMLYGAYGVDSSLEFVPVLIERAETIVSRP